MQQCGHLEDYKLHEQIDTYFSEPHITMPRVFRANMAPLTPLELINESIIYNMARLTPLKVVNVPCYIQRWV